ncbi:hypothetical protein DQ04_03371010 [Trypanosoma grayi]|uniref:hypothetical protein n=1 Tax=Trypanosoma grayi TaxID=71804 RepID=UPI0004F3EFCE|nr:hypothetical protein DQ04_03371010 [Trypanosoma grayi]KEG10721.1 hypothetical protein DQ04_03371010 [Trypanosoma grayi]
MRYRLRNVRESEDTRTKRLFEVDDALSTQEQEQVLEYLASTLRSGVMFMRVIAVLQLFLAVLYLSMLLAGYPLVYATFNDAKPQSFLGPTSSLTIGGAVAIAFSVLLLAVGGLCDMRVCRRTLYVDRTVLISTSSGAVSSSGGGNTPSGPVDAVSTATTSLLEGALPRHQYVLGFLALFPTVYWLYVMHAYYTNLARQGPLLFGVADNWMELLLVLWQPAMHIAVGKMLASLINGKNELLRLARLKYRYDKL